MNEGTVINQVLKARNRKLFDWGLSVETAETINIIEELLGRIELDGVDPNNSAQSLFIGILRRFNKQFVNLTDQEIRECLDEGFHARQERKRKRLKSGVVTLNSFESEFSNGTEIFVWLLQNRILKKLTKAKGLFNSITEDQLDQIMVNFPENYGRIVAILELSRDGKITPKPKYFYQNEGVEQWRNI